MNKVKKQILVVDDNQDIRELIIRMLDFEDYNILTVKDGEEALKIIKSHRFDLRLLGIMMPHYRPEPLLTSLSHFALAPLRQKSRASLIVQEIRAESG